MQLKPFLTSLFLTISLPALSLASAIAPIPDNNILSDADNSADTPLSLKEKLDKARNEAKGQATAITWDESQPQTFVAPISEPVITSPAEPEPIAPVAEAKPKKKKSAPAEIIAEPIQQQVSQVSGAPSYTTPYYATPKPTAPTSSIHDLLFDDDKFSTMVTPAYTAPVVNPPVAAITPAPEPMPEPVFTPPPVVTAPAPALPPVIAQAPVITPPPLQEEPAFIPAPVPMAKQEPIPQPVMRPPEVPALVEAPVLPPPIRQAQAPAPKSRTDYAETATRFEKAPLPKPIEVRKHRATSFKPRPASPVGKWVLRSMEPSSRDKNDAYCILENKFKNNLIMFIAQSADGRSNIGINYGIDMLQGNKEYRAEVMIDDSFEETFIAYAESPTTLVLQMGKKPSFFASLASGEALHVAIPGTASTFALKNLEAGLDKFSDCLAQIGAPALPSAAPVAPPAPEMDAVPIPPVMSENISTPIVDAPVMPAPSMVTTPAVADTQDWTERTLALMEKANITSSFLQRGNEQFSWSNGMMKSNAVKIQGNDILDTATRLLDQAERSCNGQFTSQIGVPETINGSAIQMMETKCAAGNDVNVTAWLVEAKGQSITAWRMEAPRDQRNSVFATRNALLNAFR